MFTADNASTQLSGADKTPSTNNVCCRSLFGPTVFGAYTQLDAACVCSHAHKYFPTKKLHNIKRIKQCQQGLSWLVTGKLRNCNIKAGAFLSYFQYFVVPTIPK